jgi:hypothetical protein
MLRRYAKTLLPRHVIAAVGLARGIPLGPLSWPSAQQQSMVDRFFQQLCNACYDHYLKANVRVMHAPLLGLGLVKQLDYIDKDVALDLTVEMASLKWRLGHGDNPLCTRVDGSWTWGLALDLFMTRPAAFSACWLIPMMHPGKDSVATSKYATH